MNRRPLRPPALQLGRATGQEGTGFQDLILKNQQEIQKNPSGFKDMVLFTWTLDT